MSLTKKRQLPCLTNQSKRFKGNSSNIQDVVLLNNMWKHVELYSEEPPFPPFNKIGELLTDEEKTHIEDIDACIDIYRKAFNEWNDMLLKQTCNTLFSIFHEIGCLSTEFGGNINKAEKGKLMVTYMNLCRSSQWFANVTRQLMFPTFRILLFAKSETIQKHKKDLIDMGKVQRDRYSQVYELHSKQYVFESLNTKSTLTDYRKNGTIMHNDAGTAVMRDLLTSLNLTKLDVFIPGRIVSRKLPFLASTPDFCVSFSEEMFQKVYKELMDHKVISHKMKAFAPHIWAEVKTLQKETISCDKVQNLLFLISSFSKGNENILLKVNHLEKSELIEECKKEAVNILRDVFVQAGWMPDELKSNKSPATLAMQRKSLLISHHLAQECKHHNILKHKLKHLFSFANALAHQSIPVLPLIQSGQAWIFVYENSDMRRCLLSLTFKTAPFILGPLGSFYTQIIEQVCCVQYLNSDAKFLFVAISKYTPQHGDIDINRPCLVYIYEVIVPNCIRLQYEKQCFKRADMLLGYSTKLASYSTKLAHSGERVLNHLLWNDNDYDDALCLMQEHADNIKQKQLEEANNTLHSIWSKKFNCVHDI